MTRGVNGATLPSRGMVPIVGVDPGGKTSGLVLRQASALRRFALVEHRDGESDQSYLTRVVGHVHEFMLSAPPGAVVACEDITHPNPHLGIANVMGLLGTAEVIGAVKIMAVVRAWPLLMVPPGGHGSQVLAGYPSELVGAREKAGGGRLRHARSAWDCAGAARLLAAAI